MTVQELIDRLQQVKDKSKPVCILETEVDYDDPTVYMESYVPTKVTELSNVWIDIRRDD